MPDLHRKIYYLSKVTAIDPREAYLKTDCGPLQSRLSFTIYSNTRNTYTRRSQPRQNDIFHVLIVTW